MMFEFEFEFWIRYHLFFFLSFKVMTDFYFVFPSNDLWF